MRPATATVRVTPETRDQLNRISAERGLSAGELIAELVAQAEDDRVLDAMTADFRQLRADSDAWELYRAEITVWDTSAGDGLAPQE